MLDLPTPVTRWLGRRLFTRGMGTRANLASWPVIPKSFVMPLQRDGLDPLAELGRTREAEPVRKLRRVFGMNVWLVTGYEEARAVLADTSSYSNDIRPLVGSEAAVGGLGFTDPPDHTRLRKLLTPEFTKRRLARLEPRIAQIVEQQLGAVEADGPVSDLVPNFAFPIPFLVICELLGLPDEDRERFRQLGHARFDLTRGGIGAFGAASESREFLLEAVRKQRTSPGEGLIGALIKDHGDEVDDVDLGGLADGVFTGGYETSASMLALGTLVLLTNPDAFASVQQGGEAVDAIVEELLRYLSVVQIAFPRFARHDLELFGTKISAGDVVVCSLTGANRDAVFGTDPDRFDPRRASGSHLAFGHGFHRCVGSELARMELRAAFCALARRFPDMALAVGPEQLRFRRLSLVYGVESLPVRLAAELPRGAYGRLAAHS